MPYRRLPNSRPAVLKTLRTAHDTYLNTPDAADRAITAEQFAKLSLTISPPSLFKRFISEEADVDNAQAAQAPLIEVQDLAAELLAMYVSHFYQVYDFGVARDVFSAGSRSYYGREINSTALPPMESHDDIAEAARRVGTGEAARQAADGTDFIAMTNPAAGEIAAQLGVYTSAHNAAQQAVVKTDNEREQAGTLYPEALELAVDICDTVEFFYRKDPEPSSRRAKARRWGVVYIFAPGETPDPEPPTPTPTPTPTP